MGFTMELTEAERELVSSARLRGAAEDDLPWYQSDLKATRARMEKLAAIWRDLPEDDRNLIQFELADRSGVSTDPWSLDVGAVVTDIACGLRPRRGARASIPGCRFVVQTLFRIWCDRGHPAEVGELRGTNLTGTLTPSPACEFIAHHVQSEFSSELGTTRDEADRWARTLRLVDSHLRALRQMGAI